MGVLPTTATTRSTDTGTAPPALPCPPATAGKRRARRSKASPRITAPREMLSSTIIARFDHAWNKVPASTLPVRARSHPKMKAGKMMKAATTAMSPGSDPP